MVMEKYDKDKVRQEIEAFERADKCKRKIYVGNEIEILKRRIGSVEVICPSCNRKQLMEISLNRKCVRCGRSFQLYPKNGTSKLAHTEINMRKLYLIHQWYSLVHHGRVMNIM